MSIFLYSSFFFHEENLSSNNVQPGINKWLRKETWPNKIPSITNFTTGHLPRLLQADRESEDWILIIGSRQTATYTHFALSGYSLPTSLSKWSIIIALLAQHTFTAWHQAVYYWAWSLRTSILLFYIYNNSRTGLSLHLRECFLLYPAAITAACENTSPPHSLSTRRFFKCYVASWFLLPIQLQQHSDDQIQE